jgi:two-component system, chemotaxis family, response regulator Rcp1
MSNQIEQVRKEILLVEDSPGDVRLMQEAFRQAGTSVHLNVAMDGVEAMEFLRREGTYVDAPRPDFIVLDLNLPKMDGREVLAHIKGDDGLKTIPTIILTTSGADTDILESYKLEATCYFCKPVEVDEFDRLVKSLTEFWVLSSTSSSSPAIINDAKQGTAASLEHRLK